MAYCLRSFVQILEEVLHPEQHHKKWVLDHDKIPDVQSLWKMASILRDFLDNSSPLIQDKIVSLEDQIMDAAEKAEDTLETYLTSQLISNPEEVFTISPPNLGEAIQAFEDAKYEVIRIMDAEPAQRTDDNMLLPVSTTRYPDHNNVIVGVTEDLEQLRNRLTSQAPELDIIPIVGMGGMGKTTLAQILYDQFSSTSKSHFDCSAWVTMSQNYDSKLILRKLLASVTGRPLDGISHEQTSELIVTLHKTLFGRRYLIVVDDMWSPKAWDDVQRAFPQENKGSRIIVTTRENIVVDYVNPKCHKMHLIEEDESWELLMGKVFGKESCPPELEEIGKKIARSCGGLPLALQVIGGLLSQSQPSIDFWEHVAYNVSSLIAETDDQFSGIFSWSFAHLPHYLKPCFLYMAGFPEDSEIPASKIIKLWVAEGFQLPIRDKSLEEAARIHLNALVDRNLIFIRKRGKSRRAKSFGIHDLLRDLCLKKVLEKKFLYYKALQTESLQEDVLFLGRIVSFAESVYPPILTPFTRSIRSNGRSDKNKSVLSCLCFKLSLLRVLDLGWDVYFSEFPGVILMLVNLRYLHIVTDPCDVSPASISILRNLQTLITTRKSFVAMISDMPQLRHLKFYRLNEHVQFGQMEGYSELPYGLHENLLSLSNIPAIEVRKLLGKIPNLRKLMFIYDEEFINLTCFHNLENLNCTYNAEYRSLHGYSPSMTFPDSLKKLSLHGFIDRSHLDAIGALPSLAILIIMYPGADRMDWEPSEGGFRELRYLEINEWSLTNWLATEVNYPVLEHLVLKRCMFEIPIEIGDIDTLKIIDVDECSPSVHDSAKRIYEEQCQLGNTLLQLRLGIDIVERNKLMSEQQAKWYEEEEARRRD